MIFMSGPLSACRRGVRQERHLAGVLDRTGDLALLLGTDPGHPPSADLAAVGDELAQQRGVLVIDVGDPVLVERVHLLLRLAKCRSLWHGSHSPYDLERWLVVEVAPATAAGGSRRGGRPRVVAGVTATATLAAALAAAGAEATAARAARHLLHLRRGVPQRRADLVDFQLVDGALLALLR